VTTAKQGDLNAGRTEIAGTPGFQEAWTLESHGNWRGLTQTTSGTPTLNQTRTHTKANEVTAIGATTGTNWGDGVVDRNGFMTRVPKPGNETQLWELTSDAWLRVVKVVDNVGGATIAEYKYNGLHHRTVKLKPNGTNWDRRDYYYSCAWQVVEERELLNTLSKTTVATVPKFQWVWGTRYIDEVILRDENKDGDGDCVDGTDQRLYYTQDANFNVTALINTAGTVVERVLYDAYGKSTLWNAAWSATQASTLYNNEVLYAGYRFDPESGLYQVRHRHYHPTLGRWVQRDPIGYHDGMRLYKGVSFKPLALKYPLALQESPERLSMGSSDDRNRHHAGRAGDHRRTTRVNQVGSRTRYAVEANLYSYVENRPTALLDSLGLQGEYVDPTCLKRCLKYLCWLLSRKGCEQACTFRPPEPKPDEPPPFSWGEPPSYSMRNVYELTPRFSLSVGGGVNPNPFTLESEENAVLVGITYTF
jgi:RHS repeat-associated protein